MTSQHAALLKRYTNEVILTYDSDEAGVRAALRAIPIVKAAGLSARVLNMRPYKDPDEFIKTHGRGEYLNLADKALPYGDFKLKKIKEKYNLRDRQ